MAKKAILFTSVGRRVEWIEQVTKALNPEIEVITADEEFDAPAQQFGNKSAILPNVSKQDFAGRLLDLCQAEQISHVFPLIDTELQVYASIKKELALFGVELVVSEKSAIDLCRDKFSFGFFLEEKGIQTPLIKSGLQVIVEQKMYCIRPRFGSRSVGMMKISGSETQKFIRRRDFVITEWIEGQEFSIDIVVNKLGKTEIIVPRKRILIRDGESIIGETVKDESIIELSKKIVELIPGLYGPLCLQLIKNEQGIFITELNPRFGGGITLSETAGAGFTDWIKSLVNKSEFVAPKWKNGSKMYRFLKGIYS
jgi:carbamoyl-phosphate synthase large subunit